MSQAVEKKLDILPEKIYQIYTSVLGSKFFKVRELYTKESAEEFAREFEYINCEIFADVVVENTITGEKCRPGLSSYKIAESVTVE